MFKFICNSRKSISIETYSILTKWVQRLIVLLLVSGGFVRLSGSGLGCEDWPNCSANRFIAQVSFHPLVEDLNRFLNAFVTIAVIFTFLLSFRLAEKRIDLRWLSLTNCFMIIFQVLMGALVVYSHLYPPFVALHFILTMAMVANGVALHHFTRVKSLFSAFKFKYDLLWECRSSLLLIMLTIAFGTVVTGAGPNAGSPGVSRFAVSFPLITFFHASFAFLTLAACAFGYSAARSREKFEVANWFSYSMLAILVQAMIGISQYMFHDYRYIVVFHLFGAAVVLSCIVKTYLMAKYPFSLSPSLRLFSRVSRQ